MNKAVFLDKDGTLINNIPFNIDFRFVKFYPDVLYCLRVFQEQDYKLFLVTNQSGIALGRFREKDFFKYRKNFLIHLEKEHWLAYKNQKSQCLLILPALGIKRSLFFCP